MRDGCKLSFPRPPRSRVLARFTSLTQIGELARRLHKVRKITQSRIKTLINELNVHVTRNVNLGRLWCEVFAFGWLL